MKERVFGKQISGDLISIIILNISGKINEIYSHLYLNRKLAVCQYKKLFHVNLIMVSAQAKI